MSEETKKRILEIYVQLPAVEQRKIYSSFEARCRAKRKFIKSSQSVATSNQGARLN